jgi:hypothetical protein
MRRFESWSARRWSVAVATTALVLAGCWGGGGGETATGVDISGVAAVGAPLGGADIEIVDKDGNVVASKKANEDGSYTLTIAATAKPPFVASARKGDVLLFSPIAEARKGTINITPITNLLAAQLSPTGDPAALAGQIKSGRADVSARQVQAVVKALVEALRPLLVNAGAESVDPLTGAFSANGTGIDKVLNSLNISINKTETGSNITITVKAAVADGDQPPEIKFASGETPPTLPSSVATATLPEDNVDQLVAAYVSKLEACYALPLAQRVSGTGGPSAIIASTCRETFFGNDPATYKQNGSTVGNTAAFGSLWNDGATGVKFTETKVEALNADGKVLIIFKSTSTAGGVSYSRTWLKKDGTALKAFGNQFAYQFQVRPWAETRTLLNMPNYSYWATGFDLNTNAAQGPFDRVIVTSPNGRTTTLKPNGALSYLAVVRNPGPSEVKTGTAVVRLAGRYMNAATTGSPRDLSNIANGEGVFWASNPAGSAIDWTEDEIKSINVAGRWKADFYLASAPGTIAATQYYTTSSRPLTVAELQQRSWAQLTTAAASELVAGTSSAGYFQMAEGERVDLSADGNLDFWSVPTGATPPTFAQVQGSYPIPVVPPSTVNSARFNDSTNMSSVARKVIISCSSQGAGDTHCSTSTAGAYSTNARINFLQLIAYDIAEIEWVSNFGVYKLTLP